CGTASPPSTPRPAGSAAARTRSPPPETSLPKTWCGCCAVSASTPESTSAASSPPARGWPDTWADPARPAPYEPSPTRSSDDHGPQALPRTGRTPPHRGGVRARRGGAEDRRLLRAARVPVRDRAGDGPHVPGRPAVPGGVRRHGRRLVRARGGPGGTGPGGLVGGHHAGGGGVAGRDAAAPVRHRGAEARVAAPTVLGRDPGRVRADGAGRRQRRGRDPHHGPAGRVDG